MDDKRYFSKKKGSKRNIEVEEESDSEDEEDYDNDSLEEYESENVFKKIVPSMRMDTIMKAGLGMAKKKIEKSFYASKIRLNGGRVLKKATNISPGDEIDLVKGYSPENEKFLTVDRLLIKSVEKVTGTGMYPVKMQLLKALTIENYEDPWSASSVSEMD